MTDSINVSDLESYAVSFLQQAEKSSDDFSRSLKIEWAVGILIALELAHKDAAAKRLRVEIDRVRALSS